MSRRRRPKQLLPLFDGQSLLGLAVDRVASLVPEEAQWICTNEDFRASIIESTGFRDDRILGEPIGRDTLNAVGFAAAVIAHEDPDAIMVVLTADHLIRPVQTFAAAIERGFDSVDRHPDALITFSIRPSFAATVYGYIERGDRVDADVDDPPVYHVERYVEKPDTETAKHYLASGRYGWSSGMFVFRAQTILDAIARFKPEAIEGLTTIVDAWGTDHQISALAKAYPTLPKISIDYAVMEPASRDGSIPVLTVPLNVEWLDVGSWPALAQTLAPDGHGNQSIGPAEFVECSNVTTVTESGNHLIATFGCENLIIVHTPDTTLVVDADRADELKTLVDRIDEERR